MYTFYYFPKIYFFKMRSNGFSSAVLFDPTPYNSVHEAFDVSRNFLERSTPHGYDETQISVEAAVLCDDRYLMLACMVEGSGEWELHLSPRTFEDMGFVEGSGVLYHFRTDTLVGLLL